MMSSVVLSLVLAFLPLTAAQAAGSLTTSAIPSEILTAGPESITDTAQIPSGTAVSVLTATATATTSSSATPTPTQSITPCHNAGGEFAPFCEPTNGSSITADDTYYVTWDSSYFSSDSSIVVQVSYTDSSSSSGSSVYSTGHVANSLGWAAVDVKSAWLQGKSSSNVTFHLSQVSTDQASATIMDGPTVELTSGDESSSSSNAPLGTSASSKSYAHLGTVVGLTIGFSFLCLLLVSGLFFLYRRRQQKHRVYGIAKSRSQRLDEPRQRSWHGQPSLENHRQGMVMV